VGRGAGHVGCISGGQDTWAEGAGHIGCFNFCSNLVEPCHDSRVIFEILATVGDGLLRAPLMCGAEISCARKVEQLEI